MNMDNTIESIFKYPFNLNVKYNGITAATKDAMALSRCNSSSIDNIENLITSDLSIILI